MTNFNKLPPLPSANLASALTQQLRPEDQAKLDNLKQTMQEGGETAAQAAGSEVKLPMPPWINDGAGDSTAVQANQDASNVQLPTPPWVEQAHGPSSFVAQASEPNFAFQNNFAAQPTAPPVQANLQQTPTATVFGGQLKQIATEDVTSTIQQQDAPVVAQSAPATTVETSQAVAPVETSPDIATTETSQVEQAPVERKSLEELMRSSWVEAGKEDLYNFIGEKELADIARTSRFNPERAASQLYNRYSEKGIFEKDFHGVDDHVPVLKTSETADLVQLLRTAVKDSSRF